MYRQYTIRAKLSEVTNSMSHVASAVVHYYQEGNGFPSSLDVPGIRTTLGVGLENVPRIALANVTDGLITMTIGNIGGDVNGSTLTLSPTIAADSSIEWIWGGNIKQAYIPKR
jgi:hypothetical protein